MTRRVALSALAATSICLGLLTSVRAKQIVVSAGAAQQIPLTPPARLAIYYGWPSLVNGAEGNLDAGTAAFAQFDLVILGDGLEHPTHGDHANTVALIENLNALGVDVFGYVDLGVSTQNLDTTALRTYIDEWATMGTAGIFFDHAGRDFGVDRPRLAAAVDHVHSLGLQAFVNAWNPDDVLAEDPPGNPTPLGAGDWYLAESHPVANGQFSHLDAWWSKSQALTTYRAQTGVRIAAISTGDEASIGWANSPAYRQALWAAYLFGFDAFGFTNPTHSASGDGANRLTPLPSLATDPGTQFTGPPVGPSGDPPTYSRPTDNGTILVWGDASGGGGTFRGGDCDTTGLGDRIWPTCSATPPAQSSPFGPRHKASEGQRYDWHRGVDIPLPYGSPIYAVADGMVRLAGDVPAYSDPMVQLIHGSTEPYLYSGYLHISSVVVSPGDLVTTGDVIGYSGASSSGFEHLHFEFRDGCLYQDCSRNPWAYLTYSDELPGVPALEGANLTTEAGALLLLGVATPADQLDLDGLDLIWGTDSVQLSFNAINATTPRDWPEALDHPLILLDGLVEACLLPENFNASSSEARYRLAFRGLDATVTGGSAALRDLAGPGSSVALSPDLAPLIVSPPAQHLGTMPGSTVTFYHALHNGGSQPLTLTLRARSAQNSNLSLSRTSLTLAPGENHAVSLNLTPVVNIPSGGGDCVVLEIDAGTGTSTIAIDSVTYSADIPTSTAEITPEQGGQLASADGQVLITFPAGAVSASATVTLTEQVVTAQSAGAYRFTGVRFTLEATDPNGDPLAMFNQPFTIRVSYDDADWQSAGIALETSLNLAYWDANASTWVDLLPCAGCYLDATNNVLLAVLDRVAELAGRGRTLAADVDPSCVVDASDLQTVAGNWRAGSGDPGYIAGHDVDGNGTIDVVDAALVAAAWGNTCW